MNSLAMLQGMIDKAATYPVFTSNDQAALIKVSGVTPNVSPWGRAIDFTTFRAAGKFFIDNLNDFKVELRRARITESKSAYDKGVKAAIEQWGAVMPADYLTNEKASFDGTLERIILQKYYALFFVEYQQCFEYRRTGLPVLPKVEGMLNNGIMPVRFRYPVAVQTNNNQNYTTAVENMGGDDINVKVWWEK